MLKWCAKSIIFSLSAPFQHDFFLLFPTSYSMKQFDSEIQYHPLLSPPYAGGEG